MRTKQIIYSAALAASILVSGACGGNPKSGLNKGGGVPPPPPVLGAGGNAGGEGPPAPKREVSKDARKDYENALAFFQQQDKGSWNESSCRGAADRFESVAREHTELVEAQFMAGLSFHRCNMLKEAEAAYQAAT